jgi:hypothetical protein
MQTTKQSFVEEEQQESRGEGKQQPKQGKEVFASFFNYFLQQENERFLKDT